MINRMINNIFIVVLLFTLIVACSIKQVNAAPSMDSHSCPEPGHGPCYKCD